MLNWIVWNRTVYLYFICLALDNQQSLLCHKPKQKYSDKIENSFKEITEKWESRGNKGLKEAKEKPSV